jgi:drug/metabolite transporter (DMT)-like permease
VFWALAPYYLAASSIGFFVRFALIWSVLAAVTIFPDERRLLRLPRFYLGMGLGIGGFAAMSLATSVPDADVSVTGIVIILLCSLFFGLYAVSVRCYLRDTNPLVGFGVVSQYVSLGTLIAMGLWGTPTQLGSLSATGWAALVSSSVLGIALGHLFLYAAVQRVGAAITSGVQSVTPFLTVAMAWTFLGESMTPWKWVAGIVMVVGAVVLLSAQHVIHREPTGDPHFPSDQATNSGNISSNLLQAAQAPATNNPADETHNSPSHNRPGRRPSSHRR